MKISWKKMREDKKWYRDYQAKEKELPETYQTAIKALDAYLMQFWGTDEFMNLLDDMLAIFQENASENVPINALVGDDPVAFADELLAQYQQATWMRKQQDKLRNAFKELKS